MGLYQDWKKFRKFQVEERQTFEEILLQAGLKTDTITKDQAINIPSVSACTNLICETIASLPIKLYQETGETVSEVKNDPRIALLNDSTGDYLTGYEFKRGLIEDYLLEGNGYAYINRIGNKVQSLHYISENFVQVNQMYDPIFKNFQIFINGVPYEDYELVKLVRKTKNGITGKGIIAENNKILSVVWNSLMYEERINLTGGNKKGFITAQSRLSENAIDELKRAWRNLYANNGENVVILNAGLDWKESSSTSVELQMNEQKKTNSTEICKLFNVNPLILEGNANDQQYNMWVKTCIIPILVAFETALNNDLLLESEKESFYFAFDYNEILKGSINERFTAYSQAVQAGWISKNEIRYMENLQEIEGLDVVSFSLGEVIYDIKSQTFFTPNTSTITDTGEGEKIEGSLEEESSESKEEKLAEGDIVEEENDEKIKKND